MEGKEGKHLKGRGWGLGGHLGAAGCRWAVSRGFLGERRQGHGMNIVDVYVNMCAIWLQEG